VECWNFSTSRSCSNVLLHTADWFLSAAYFRFRQLPAAYCLLPTSSSRLMPHPSRLLLLTAFWRLPTASLPTSSSRLMPHTSLPTANWRLPTSSLLMPHPSRLTPHAFFCLLPSGDCQLPHCHLLPHASCLTPPFQLPTANWRLPTSSRLTPHTFYCPLPHFHLAPFSKYFCFFDLWKLHK